MLSLSTTTVIIYSQILLVFIGLFITWFFISRKTKTALKETLLTHEKLKSELDELKNKYDKIELELKSASAPPNKAEIIKETIEQELAINREKIEAITGNKETIHNTHIYEFRSTYLQLEQKWFLTKDKNNTYWETIYAELNTLLNKLHDEKSKEEINESNQDEVEQNIDPEPPQTISEAETSPDVDIDDILNANLDN